VSQVILARGAVDISDFAVDTTFLSTVTFSPGTFNGGAFVFVGAPKITGVSLDPLSTIVPVSFSYTDNSVLFNFAGHQVSSGSRLLLDVATAPVPEPATAWLWGFGLLFLASIALKRKAA
jgi:hypothetical protein